MRKIAIISFGYKEENLYKYETWTKYDYTDEWFLDWIDHGGPDYDRVNNFHITYKEVFEVE